MEGATWSVGSVAVTAHAAKVAGPQGPLDGFAIRGETDSTLLEIDYAPALASVTHYARMQRGEAGPGETLDLVATGRSPQWTWVERGAEAYYSAQFGDPGQARAALPVRLDVVAQDDEVYAWALADVGARVVLQLPGAAPWTFEGHGVPAFSLQRFPAIEGPWSVAGAPGDQDSWAYVQLHAVRYVTGP